MCFKQNFVHIALISFAKYLHAIGYGGGTNAGLLALESQDLAFCNLMSKGDLVQSDLVMLHIQGVGQWETGICACKQWGWQEITAV